MLKPGGSATTKDVSNCVDQLPVGKIGFAIEFPIQGADGIPRILELLNDALLDPRYYFPFNLESAFAEKWAQYFMNDGSKLAEAPPAAVQTQMDLYIELIATADKAKQKELFDEILQIAAEQFYVMGTVLPADGYVVANAQLGNVPEGQVYTWMYPQPGPMETAQLFYKK